MRFPIRFMQCVVIFGALTFAAHVWGQGFPKEGPVPTQATVSVESRAQVALDPALIKVTVNGRDTPLISLERSPASSAQIAILIDDGLSLSFAAQLDDLRKFLLSLPAKTQVLVAYMQHGKAIASKGDLGFSTDHAAVAGGIRLPIGTAGESGSSYFCLSDIAKKWPSTEPGPRFVLMMTDGADPYSGKLSYANASSPYVEVAVADAQRAAISVYAIASTQANDGERFSDSTGGQTYLTQVTQSTGGILLTGGISSAATLPPFLKQFQALVENSYTATFLANATHEKVNTLAKLKITTSQPKVRLHVPEAVHPGVTVNSASN